MNQGQITRNTTYVLIASTFQKVGAFIFFIILTRFLGVEEIGKYVFAMSFAGLFAILPDLGLSFALTREIARDENKGAFYFNTALSFKIIFSLLTYLVIFIAINLLGYSTETKILVYLSGLMVAIDGFNLSFTAIFRGLQKLKYEAWIIIIHQILVILFAGLALYLKMSLEMIIAAIVLTSVINFIYYVITLYKKTDLRIKFNFDKKILVFLLKISAPFALASIFSRIFWDIDKVFLSKMAGDQAVGFYGASYKLIFALQFIPLSLIAALFPAFSKYFINDKEKLSNTFEKAISYLMMIAIPITFGIIFLADKLILKIYGASYISSIIPLQILSSALLFMFLIFPLTTTLNACEKHKANMFNWAVAAIFCIALNLFLIPQYKEIGASIAFLSSNVFLFFLSLYRMEKIVAYRKKYLINVLLKTIFSALAMSTFIFYLKEIFSIFIIIPLAGLIYVILLFSTKTLKKEDLQSIKKSFIVK
ncbi:MAG: Polysaccharide biosynthesis protein [Parcubacteria group bacterium Athens1014_10]|nr:MAG: Polysaccharide biosynthesis protein [Parcubacteria group bacterium Athens1014_10]TSD06051.1 MAG: Polysaccharide biosynthesis protein [Parcubacteria group bacterium Athens0714_12]